MNNNDIAESAISYLFDNDLLVDFTKAELGFKTISESELNEWIVTHFPNMVLKIANPSSALLLKALSGSAKNEKIWQEIIDLDDELALIKAVKINAQIIGKIKDPPPVVQMASLKSNIDCFRAIHNPCEEAKMYLVCKRPADFIYINDPSEEVMVAAVSRSYSLIKNIKNPSKAVQIAAAKQNPYALCSVDCVDEEVALAVVSARGGALEFIKSPSEAVMLAAVAKAPSAVRFIEDPPESVQLEVVQNRWSAIRYIKNPTDKVRVLTKLHS